MRSLLWFLIGFLILLFIGSLTAYGGIKDKPYKVTLSYKDIANSPEMGKLLEFLIWFLLLLFIGSLF